MCIDMVLHTPFTKIRNWDKRRNCYECEKKKKKKKKNKKGWPPWICDTAISTKLSGMNDYPYCRSTFSALCNKDLCTYFRIRILEEITYLSIYLYCKLITVEPVLDNHHSGQSKVVVAQDRLFYCITNLFWARFGGRGWGVGHPRQVSSKTGSIVSFSTLLWLWIH